MAAIPVPAEVPPKVQQAWEEAHAALQAHLEFFYERAGSGKLNADLDFEGGVPRRWWFLPHMREQVGSREATLQATRRRR
jgi:hypothetical protein